ncbi:hypothetical protein ACI514_29090 [Pseudomonas sp. M20]|uniref:hypothetical protein n=1 Tax=Pseudomonas sp. M20 TaxID=3379129 RepID=UPI00386B8AFE
MSPKIPRKRPYSTLQQSDPISSPDTPLTTGAAAGYRLSGLPDYATPLQPGSARTGADTPQTPAVVIRDMPMQSQTIAAGSLDNYWLNENFLRGMKPADDDGIRWIVGRRFADVEWEGSLHTTHVDLDASGVYRSKLLTERQPSGPRLYKNEGRPTWRLTEQPVKRPRPARLPTYFDKSRYTVSSRSPDAQGYYEFTPTRSTSQSDIRFAFKDSSANWFEVDPPVAGFGAEPTHLKHWTDQEIWLLYDIKGADIPRLRAEAHAIGKAPPWVESVSSDSPPKELANNALRWLHPDMTLKQRKTLLQSYNLLPSQLLRLQQEMTSGQGFPQWAQAHKRLTEEVNNPQRLEQWSQTAVEDLNLKRDARHDWYSPKASLTREVREALLNRLGYLRNQNNCLYRTDIPALFRGDERTPFELAKDGFMLPRYHHKPGATTHKPMSATFSLKEGKMYASAPDPEYLRFNRQTNKYPGRERHESSSDSDSNDANNASDTDSIDSSDWSDPGTSVPWNYERNYRRTREKQNEMFLYVLDTRQLEVVPHEENMSFNSEAIKTPTTWFPSDDFEGLVSVTRSGLESDRIWLLNSSLTKAVQIDHLLEQAGASAKRIKAATHAGHRNKFEYDQLIDKTEAAGKPVLRLSGNGNEFAYDISWPDVHTPTTQNP